MLLIHIASIFHSFFGIEHFYGELAIIKICAPNLTGAVSSEYQGYTSENRQYYSKGTMKM